MRKYRVVVHCRKNGAIGVFSNEVFDVNVPGEDEPARTDILNAWKIQYGASAKDGYELHHIVGWALIT